jgi:hypothetical protein
MEGIQEASVRAADITMQYKARCALIFVKAKHFDACHWLLMQEVPEFNLNSCELSLRETHYEWGTGILADYVDAQYGSEVYHDKK